MVGQITTPAAHNLRISTVANRNGNNSMNSNNQHLILPVVQNNANIPMHCTPSIFTTPMEDISTPSISTTPIEERNHIREIGTSVIPKHDIIDTVPKQVKDNNGVLPSCNVYIGFEKYNEQLSALIRDQPESIRDSPTVHQLSQLVKTDTSRYDYIANDQKGSIISDYHFHELGRLTF